MKGVAQTIIGFLFAISFFTGSLAANDEATTIDKAERVLKEIMEIPARRIPVALLDKSYGVAIIPSVIKVSFIGGVRHGHGVLLVKDKDGDWGLPEFITLTGGSVGYQAGVQSTDVVLVFKSAKSIDNIRRGKFTIGVDAAAAAGPVGRNAAAATDAQMQAEILSYSRSRGLFVGVSLDGTVLEIDNRGYRDFYGDPGQQPVRHVPTAAIKLMETIAGLAGSDTKKSAAGHLQDPNQLRKELAQSARSLNSTLPTEWQRFLAMPPAVYTTQEHATLESLAACRRNFDRVANDATYAILRSHPEFQTTYELLQEYTATLEKFGAPPRTLNLPPPPVVK